MFSTLVMSSTPQSELLENTFPVSPYPSLPFCLTMFWNQSLLVLYGLPHDNLFQREKSSCQVQGQWRLQSKSNWFSHTRKKIAWEQKLCFQRYLELLLALLRPLATVWSIVQASVLVSRGYVVPMLLCCCSGPTGRSVKQCPAQTEKKESQVSVPF